MASNAVKSEFRTSKIWSKISKKIEIPYWSKMARNAIKSDFRTSKMAAEKKKFCIDLNGQNCYRNWISDIQNGRSIWNGQKCNKKWFLNIKNVRRRPFCKKIPKNKKLRIDLKWPAMGSKVNFGHPKWPTAAVLSKISKKIKFRIDLKWPEMRSKVNFGHPRWPMAAILSKISKKNKVAYRSEMAINAIENEFRTSTMSAGGHFKKKKEFHIDLKWPEIWSTAIILSKIKKKLKLHIDLARNAFKSEFRTSKMGAGGHFIKIFWKKSFVLIWNGQKCHQNSKVNFGHPKRPPAAI